MSTVKYLLKFFAAISAVSATGFTLACGFIAVFFSGLTASGNAMREMQENDLRFDKDVDLDKFTCEKKTQSILSLSCSNGHAKAAYTSMYHEDLEKKLNAKYEL